MKPQIAQAAKPRLLAYIVPLTSVDTETGYLSRVTEDQFVARFRAGRIIPGSPMPWQAFSRMAEEDLRAIYRYLKTVAPTRNDVGPPVVNLEKS